MSYPYYISHKLVLVQCGSEGQVVENIEITELSQMLDYSQPHAPGKPFTYSAIQHSQVGEFRRCLDEGSICVCWYSRDSFKSVTRGAVEQV